VVEEYLQGGVFPMVGEGAYTGFLSYAIPTNTRPSNQWRTYALTGPSACEPWLSSLTGCATDMTCGSG
jgi:hypothetical protein